MNISRIFFLSYFNDVFNAYFYITFSRSSRKGGDKLESKVKESTNNKNTAKEQSKKEEEGVIYKIKCKDCHMVYIGETKFTMNKRSILLNIMFLHRWEDFS